MPKKINVLYLLITVLSVSGSVFASFVSTAAVSIPIWLNLLVSQMLIIIPALVLILLNQNQVRVMLPYKKINPVNIILIIVFTELLDPLISFVNVASQLFTRNEVLTISSEVLSLPFPVMFFLIGIMGPFCEEFVFRGIIFFGFRSSTDRVIASAIASAAFFGLIHMNLNQFCYAFALGAVFALTDEIFDSLWPSFIMHATVNSKNVVMLYASEKMMEFAGKETLNEAYDMVANKTYILIMAVFLLFIAFFTTALAILLLWGMCKIEGKEYKLKDLFKKSESKNKILYISGCVAIMVNIFMIFGAEPLLKTFK